MSVTGLASLPHPQLPPQLPSLPAAAKIDSDGDHDNNAPDAPPPATASSNRPLNIVA